MPIFFHMLLPRSCTSKWYQWLRIWLSRNIRFVGVNVGMSARNRHFQTNYWCITVSIAFSIMEPNYFRLVFSLVLSPDLNLTPLAVFFYVFAERNEGSAKKVKKQQEVSDFKNQAHLVLWMITCMGLNHCCLVTPFGDVYVDVDQLTLTRSGNVLMPDSIPMLNSYLWSSDGIHLRSISQSVNKILFCIDIGARNCLPPYRSNRPPSGLERRYLAVTFSRTPPWYLSFNGCGLIMNVQSTHVSFSFSRCFSLCVADSE